MEHQLAGSATGFNPFCDALKADAFLFQLTHNLNQVRQTAPEAIQAPDN